MAAWELSLFFQLISSENFHGSINLPISLLEAFSSQIQRKRQAEQTATREMQYRTDRQVHVELDLELDSGRELESGRQPWYGDLLDQDDTVRPHGHTSVQPW